jgi:hypothetical protein
VRGQISVPAYAWVVLVANFASGLSRGGPYWRVASWSSTLLNITTALSIAMGIENSATGDAEAYKDRRGHP